MVEELVIFPVIPSHISGHEEFVLVGVTHASANGLGNVETAAHVIIVIHGVISGNGAVSALVIVDYQFFFGPNMDSVAIHGSQSDFMVLFHAEDILQTTGHMNAVKVIGVIDEGIVEVGSVEAGVLDVVDSAEHIGGVQSYGESFADFEGVTPIELVESAFCRVVVCYIAHIFNESGVFNVVAHCAEGNESHTSPPVAGNGQADCDVTGAGKGVFLNQGSLCKSGGVDGSGGIAHKRERIEGGV